MAGGALARYSRSNGARSSQADASRDFRKVVDDTVGTTKQIVTHPLDFMNAYQDARNSEILTVGNNLNNFLDIIGYHTLNMADAGAQRFLPFLYNPKVFDVPRELLLRYSSWRNKSNEDIQRRLAKNFGLPSTQPNISNSVKLPGTNMGLGTASTFATIAPLALKGSTVLGRYIPTAAKAFLQANALGSATEFLPNVARFASEQLNLRR